MYQVIIIFPSGKRQVYRDSGLDRYGKETADYLAAYLAKRGHRVVVEPA